ncbi:MAG TPA: enoyl-CoA hydratase/isomerase family protein [Acidimicrobiales bacterium]|nr:enoyl-CoA hydratase/isomerase family protein [Acidimicrobiales bacterium]
MPGITLERHDGVAVLTVDNPERRNALDPGIARDLIDVCDEVDADPAVGAAVVRGAGGTFCSGADRAVLDSGQPQAGDETYKAMGLVYRSFHRVGQLAVPTVAAVRGAVVGAGLNLMLATDLRVVADDAKVLAGFLRIGVHPGGGFFTLAGRSAGREAAAALGLFSETLVGPALVEAGVAWQAVPDGEVDERALALAGRAAADPELARLAVQSFRRELGPPAIPWDVAIDFERPSQMWSLDRRAAVTDP